HRRQRFSIAAQCDALHFRFMSQEDARLGELPFRPWLQVPDVDRAAIALREGSQALAIGTECLLGHTAALLAPTIEVGDASSFAGRQIEDMQLAHGEGRHEPLPIGAVADRAYHLAEDPVAVWLVVTKMVSDLRTTQVPDQHLAIEIDRGQEQAI